MPCLVGGLKCLVFLVLTAALKITSGKILIVKDDVSGFSCLKNLLVDKF